MNPDDLLAVADILPEPLLVVQGRGRIVHYNAASAELLGLRKSDVGRRLSEFAEDAADPELLEAYLSACSRTRTLIPGALAFRTAEGGTLRCRCNGAVIRPGSAEEPALIVLRLHPHETAGSRFVLLNRKLDELTREISIRRKVEEHRSQLLAQERELRQQLELQTIELEQQAEESQGLSEELELTNDHLTRALSIAESANRAKGDFLAMMSHELRTPINATLGYLELLVLGLRGPLTAEQQKDLDRIRRNQHHLLRVVTDILTFSRADAGKLEFDIEPFRVAEVLDTAAALLEPLANDRNVRLAVAPCADSLLVRADRAKVEQIVVNVIGNAFKFSPVGSEVSVWCDGASSENVAIHVRDQGPGIPAEKLEQIFEPFVQLDATLTRRTEGTGLGLTISREFARQMDGDLCVENVQEGGATFTLVLPRADTLV